VDVVQGLESLPLADGPSVVTVGFFDGVHLGHRWVLDVVAERAAEHGLRSVAITFDRHPREILHPGTEPRLLTSVERKAELVAARGIDLLVVLEFDRDFSLTTAESFVRDVLARGVHARHATTPAGPLDLPVVVRHVAGPGRTANCRARQQGGPVPLQRLRRLFAPRHRVPLPRIAVCEEPAERPLRRDARRPVRSGRFPVHLEPRVRPSQVRGPRAADARSRPRDSGRIAPWHLQLGECPVGQGPLGPSPAASTASRLPTNHSHLGTYRTK